MELNRFNRLIKRRDTNVSTFNFHFEILPRLIPYSRETLAAALGRRFEAHSKKFQNVTPITFTENSSTARLVVPLKNIRHIVRVEIEIKIIIDRERSSAKNRILIWLMWFDLIYENYTTKKSAPRIDKYYEMSASAQSTFQSSTEIYGKVPALEFKLKSLLTGCPLSAPCFFFSSNRSTHLPHAPQPNETANSFFTFPPSITYTNSFKVFTIRSTINRHILSGLVVSNSI